MEQKPKVRLPRTVHMRTLEKCRDILAWHILQNMSVSKWTEIEGGRRNEQLCRGESPEEGYGNGCRDHAGVPVGLELTHRRRL